MEATNLPFQSKLNTSKDTEDAGIQTLLDVRFEPTEQSIPVHQGSDQVTNTKFEQAEREAQKIVQRDRTKRIKDAKSEAQKEIEEYRKQKEEEFKKFEAEHSSGNKKAEEEANKDAEAKLREIQDTGKAKGDRVIEDLIHAVLDVQPEVPDKLATET
ncbi:proton-transporting ATPase [Emydomyces testavorans]|uniref:V-type proton ATPase subunit G n=1 Tax=Emydomyces testavorans TaxID=2070801 RepID=A0AAF0DJK1_9EURO|nr:proton-transporting ATPase [Emydomyces testavorans]